jgi:hypothetical protein
LAQLNARHIKPIRHNVILKLGAERRIIGLIKHFTTVFKVKHSFQIHELFILVIHFLLSVTRRPCIAEVAFSTEMPLADEKARTKMDITDHPISR